MKLMKGYLAIGLISWVVLSAVHAWGQGEWSEFRGPNGTGISEAVGLPLQLDAPENTVWKTPIHGKGWSSPVVWGDQVWLTTATEDGKEMNAICIDRDSGKIIHDLLVFANPEPQFCHAKNSYASCTPVIEQGRVYVHFGSYGTAAIDTKSGKILWTRQDLPCDHFRGPASSPILHGDDLYVSLDGFDYQYVVALNKKTGETAWKKDRNIQYEVDNGDMKKAYSTPVIVDVEGQAQLVSPSASATIAYDPQDGREIWRVRHGGMNVAMRPVRFKDTLLLNTGDGGLKLLAVKLGGTGDITDSHIAWQNKEAVPSRCGYLLLDNLLYFVNESGIVTCLDANSGDLVWRERLGKDYSASPISAENHIYLFGETGQFHVLEAGRTFKLLAKGEFDSGFMATPAIAGKAIFARTEKHLYRLELPK